MKKELLMTSVQAVFCAKEQWAPRQVYGPGARPHFLLYTVLDGKGILQYKNNILTTYTPVLLHLKCPSLFNMEKQSNKYKYLIGDICFMVGINSPSYFSKLFLKQFGMTPKDFEKQSQADKEKIDMPS